MDAFLERVRIFIESERLLREGDRVVIGLSGGADSVVLTYALHRLGYDVLAAHANYKLRGNASDEDEQFARAFCQSLSIPIHVACFDTKDAADVRRLSLQATARELRYEFFLEIAQREGIPVVAVGHHRDDQAETVLLNLFRGSGPEGLAGMRSRRRLSADADVALVRPLLFARRSEVERAASGAGLSWRVDETNTSPAYRRGSIRSLLMPLIEEHFGEGAAASIARSAELMRAYLEAHLGPEMKEAFERASIPESQALDVENLRRLPEVLRGRVILEGIRRWIPGHEASARIVKEMEGLLDAQPGRRIDFGAGSVWRGRRRLRFVPSSEGPYGVDDVFELRSASGIQTATGRLEAELIPSIPGDLVSDDSNIEYVDAERIRFPLTVRRWLPGDRFQPFGMDRSKKISDFLTDEKVEPHRRKNVMVVLSDGVIIWVVGHRIAEGVRIRDTSGAAVRLAFIPDAEGRREAAT